MQTINLSFRDHKEIIKIRGTVKQGDGCHLSSLISLGECTNHKCYAQSHKYHNIYQAVSHGKGVSEHVRIEGEDILDGLHEKAVVDTADTFVHLIGYTSHQDVSDHYGDVSCREQIAEGLNLIGKLRDGDICSDHKTCGCGEHSEESI